MSTGTPSAWLLRHLPAVRATAALGPALDVACGRGRNARALAAQGHAVVGVDRNAAHLRELARAAPVACVRADLETGHGLPFAAGRFGAVLVFRYLHRPLLPELAALLVPGGLLVYETFTTAQRELGWGPRRDAFLLAPGELASFFPELETLAFDERLADEPEGAQASLLARRPR